MEGCVLLAEKVEKEEMEDWWTRHSQKKGDVGVKNEKKKQGEKMESFFCAVHESLTDFRSFDLTNFLCNLRSDNLSFRCLCLCHISSYSFT